ncbi:MAG: hypothetical protein ABIQ41_01330, partial [Gemmatimonadales bacterium]
GKPTTRKQIVKMLRKELAAKLGAKISDDPDAPTHYDILNNGATKEFAQEVPEFSLRNMQNVLASDEWIGFGYLEFICNALNKDIYILEMARRDIYASYDLHLTIKGNRRSIVLYYIEGHYELVGLLLSDGSFGTHFDPDNKFIRFLYDRVQAKISGVKE